MRTAAISPNPWDASRCTRCDDPGCTGEHPYSVEIFSTLTEADLTRLLVAALGEHGTVTDVRAAAGEW